MADAESCVKHPLHYYAVLNLEDSEQLWRKSLTNEARKGVNRGQKAGLTAKVTRNSAAVEDPFYDLYLISMKRLGVPPHPQSFFLKLSEGLGDRLVAAWVMSKEEPVAVLLGAIAGLRLQIFVTASLPQAWSMRPNDLAHWELIRWSAAAGLSVFDFGSARYVGQIQFKKKWGVSMHEYCYYTIGPPDSAATARIQTVRTSSWLMIAMSRVWGSVMPIKWTRVLGPPIRKYLTK
jgi:lipid II:glycine glycyltransferase (peptidoglycan interpeptide bridge formation enzyme)